VLESQTLSFIVLITNNRFISRQDAKEQSRNVFLASYFHFASLRDNLTFFHSSSQQ